MSSEGNGFVIIFAIAMKSLLMIGHCADGARLVKVGRSTQAISTGDDIVKSGAQLQKIDDVLVHPSMSIDVIDGVDLTIDVIENEQVEDRE